MARLRTRKISQIDLRYERFARLLRTLNYDTDATTTATAYQYHLGQAHFLISTLRARYRLALVTNGLHEVQRSRLALSPIGNAFESVIISEEIGVAKPHRDYFEAVFAALNHPRKDETIIIGDSLSSDILGGINFGIDTCWYNPEGRTHSLIQPPTFEIARLESLHDILANRR